MAGGSRRPTPHLPVSTGMTSRKYGGSETSQTNPALLPSGANSRKEGDRLLRSQGEAHAVAMMPDRQIRYCTGKFDLIVPGTYSSHMASRSTPAPKNCSRDMRSESLETIPKAAIGTSSSLLRSWYWRTRNAASAPVDYRCDFFNVVSSKPGRLSRRGGRRCCFLSPLLARGRIPLRPVSLSSR